MTVDRLNIAVGISISDSEESRRLGFPPPLVARMTALLAEALCSHGVRLVFGHDWRPNGVMLEALRLAQDYSGPASGAEPMMTNLVPWPDHPALGPEDRDRLSHILRVEEAGLPQGLTDGSPGSSELAVTDRTTPEHRGLRARALTHLRHQLVARSDARLCLGGRLRGYSGRYPGIVEEAYLTLEAGQPLYLSGLIGGASALLISALRGEDCPPDLLANPALKDAVLEPDPYPTLDPRTIWDRFVALGEDGLARMNGLTPEENRELLEAETIDAVAELVLRGIGKGVYSRAQLASEASYGKPWKQSDLHPPKGQRFKE